MMGEVITHKDESGLLKALLDAAVEAIVISDESGEILLFNRGAQTLFGYTEEEAQGQNVRILMGSHDHAHHDRYMESYLGTGQRKIIGIGREVAGRHRGGDELSIHLSVGHASVDGRQLFVAIMQDLRPRNQLQSELQAERRNISDLQQTLASVHRTSTLGEMSAGIAHEINQPLAAMATFADAGRRLLSKDPPDGERLNYALEQIGEQARRAGRVVERIRALSRREDTPRSTRPINEVIRELMELAELEARDSGAPIVLELEENLPPVDIDPVQIQQVLLNLIRNGLESMVRPSQISQGLYVISEQVDGEVRVAVVDHGTGVHEDQRERIFEPFHTSKPSGMGVGLSICRTIMRGHGGRLWCEENPAGGSRFVLALPPTQEIPT
ncbi:MAG: PAS domain S-box protein [Pseudomonadota bacterium]